ncbi:MAG: class I SAM-dependent methyltransferase, partial [Candidatus Aegiribacteria sp.]|nr:class I SAM-dependent methyltransferase [Candidatus Aegiribacteria sp.]
KCGFALRPHEAPGMELRYKKWQHLRNTFNRSADVYDRIRPGYPTTLIDDVINLSGIPEHGRILEIGCATGKSTELFASTGFTMDCLDIGSDLAAVAAAKFREFDNVRVIVSPFEDWKSDGHLYDLIIAATSFHWVDPALAYIKSAAFLKLAGALAVFTNKHVQNNEGFFAAVQDVYRDFAPSMTNATGNIKENLQTLPGEEHFEDPIFRSYPWSMEYSTSQYIDLLSTYSDHINLPDAERKALFTGIENLINREYGGSLLKHYEAVLILRRKK